MLRIVVYMRVESQSAKEWNKGRESELLISLLYEIIG